MKEGSKLTSILKKPGENQNKKNKKKKAVINFKEIAKKTKQFFQSKPEKPTKIKVSQRRIIKTIPNVLQTEVTKIFK